MEASPSISNVRALLKEKITKNKNNISWFETILSYVKGKDSEINIVTVCGTTLKWIVITRKNVPAGMGPSDIELQICSDKTYKLKVIGKLKQEGKFTFCSDPASDVEFTCTLDIVKSPCYVVCPGILDYAIYHSQIRYDPKFVRRWEQNKRIDSEKCLLWHKPKRRAKYENENMCDNCIHLQSRLKSTIKREQQMSTPKKAARTHPSSHRPLKFMSPTSQKRRKERQKSERRKLKKLLRKMRVTDVELNDEQNDEMHEIGDIIEQNFNDDLHEIFEEIEENSEAKTQYVKQVSHKHKYLISKKKTFAIVAFWKLTLLVKQHFAESAVFLACWKFETILNIYHFQKEL